MNSVTVHFPHPETEELCLCGCLCTRNDPHTTREDGKNVDCLQCIMLHEKKEPNDL